MTATAAASTTPKRPKLLIFIVAVLVLGTGNAGVQALLPILRVWDTVDAITGMQAIIAVTAGVAAFGAWRLRSWAPWVALAYAIETGAMIFSLPYFIEIDPAGVKGIRSSAALMLGIGALLFWGLRVALRRAGANAG